jgi:glycosyltransferase involved in cell wall biosynthesis
LRILMLLEKPFPPDIRVENEAASLLDAGHDVHLLCTEDARRKTDLPASLERLVVHTTIPKTNRPRWRRRVPNFSLVWFYDARWARRIQELNHAVGRFDAIHVHDLPLVRTAQRAAKRTGAFVVADLHENYPMVLPTYTAGMSLSPVARFLLDPSRWARYEQLSVPDCSAVLVVTDEMRSRLTELGVRGARIAVVENLVDSERFLSYHVDKALQDELRDRYVITYAGGFLSNRGLDTALRAMPAVIREVPSALLLLVGDGRTRSELEQLSAEMGLEGYVRFEGWVEFSEMPSYLAASDVCILPLVRSVQTDSALSHKLFQYMLMGKPVVASACAAMGRVIEDADCGLLFPPGDSEAMAEALIRLRDAEMRTRLGEQGRQAVHDRYNWSLSASRLLAVYDKLDRGRASASSPAVSEVVLQRGRPWS